MILKNFFEVKYEDYETHYGFNLLKFIDDFLSESTNTGGGILDLIEEKYGYSVATIINTIINIEHSAKILNRELETLKDGTKAKYQITGNWGKKTVEGEIYFPFALRKIKRGNYWVIDHLPSGTYILEKLNKVEGKQFLRLIKHLRPFCKEHDIGELLPAKAKELLGSTIHPLANLPKR